MERESYISVAVDVQDTPINVPKHHQKRNYRRNNKWTMTTLNPPSPLPSHHSPLPSHHSPTSQQLPPLPPPPLPSPHHHPLPHHSPTLYPPHSPGIPPPRLPAPRPPPPPAGSLTPSNSTSSTPGNVAASLNASHVLSRKRQRPPSQRLKRLPVGNPPAAQREAQRDGRSHDDLGTVNADQTLSVVRYIGISRHIQSMMQAESREGGNLEYLAFSGLGSSRHRRRISQRGHSCTEILVSCYPDDAPELILAGRLDITRDSVREYLQYTN